MATKPIKTCRNCQHRITYRCETFPLVQVHECTRNRFWIGNSDDADPLDETCASWEFDLDYQEVLTYRPGQMISKLPLWSHWLQLKFIQEQADARTGSEQIN